jgi:hypothetical protein
MLHQGLRLCETCYILGGGHTSHVTVWVVLSDNMIKVATAALVFLSWYCGTVLSYPKLVSRSTSGGW